MIKILIIVIILFTSKVLADDGKCRILALRGGGVHGAFEAGVLQALTERMPANEIKYDYVSGVSVGAMNASIIALFPPGDEKEAVEYLVQNLYDGLDSK